MGDPLTPLLRRDLAQEIRRRADIRPIGSAPSTPLPLVQSSARVAAALEAGTPAAGQARTVQRRAEEGQAASETPVPPRPSPQQIADRVYELLKQDLHIERERLGNSF